MTNSPLRLSSYVFVKTRVESADLDSKEVSKVIEVDTEIRLGEEESSGKWILFLTVKTKDPVETGKMPAYRAEVVVAGRFDVDQDYPKEKTPRMVAVTGSSLLYGVVREMIANITSRSVFGIYTLPLTSFVDLDPKRVE